MYVAWEQPLLTSWGQIVSDSREHCERRIRLYFPAAATRNGEIRSTPGTQARTILATQWLHGKCQRYELDEYRPEVDLTAPKPAGLQFVTQTQTVPRQRRSAFRIRGHPVSRRFEDKPKLLAESLTIAREAAPAFEFHHTLGAALKPDIVSDPLDPTDQLDGFRELTRQTGLGRERRLPPGRVAFE
jgi:hypothetical protein